VSPGICRGKVFVLGRPDRQVIPRIELPAEELPNQISRLEEALRHTREQIHEVQRHLAQGMGSDEASIFEAHLLLLQDPMILEEVTSTISEERVTAEWAFQMVVEKFGKMLSAVDDEYLRSRAADLRDVSARVLDNLAGRADPDMLRHLTEPCLIISHDLSPSQTALLDKKMVVGFATDIGSRTSHTAIMARSLRIPAVVGLQTISETLVTGEYALLDGYNGLVVINPTDQTLFEYGQLVRKQVALEEKLRDTLQQPAVTLDGVRITLSANVEQAGDTEAVLASGADGVGLFRTEYIFINRETLPTEEEQYQSYRTVAATLKPAPVVIRTLDLGGDKFLSQLQVPSEMNPFLGWRAIRFCLEERDIFRAQLRAILRASAEGNVKMMYPMISGIAELEKANALVEECKTELRAAGIAFDTNLEIGVMIEIPSAALAADALARRAKFFSIGTNDLIQYSLAVDRLNEKIAHLYQPTHPAIVKLIKLTADAGRRQGLWVGVCGEMAGDPLLTPLLLGLGVTELSVAPAVVPHIKFLIRRLKMSELEKLAEFALGCESAAEILEQSKAIAHRCAPVLFANTLIT
jgi:phosphotransferase system enzyme I (PtsI)